MNPNKEQIFDIYDVWYEPLLTQIWFVIILFFLLTIIISLVLYFIYVRLYKRPKIVHPLIAIEKRLIYLDSMIIQSESDSKKIYFEITELLKEYIFYRYHMSVIGLTDHELLQWAQTHISQDQLKILEELLVHATTIKFEHQLITTKQAKESIALMQQFITQNKEL